MITMEFNTMLVILNMVALTKYFYLSLDLAVGVGVVAQLVVH